MIKFIDFKNILSRINRWEIILVIGFLTPILIIFLIFPYVPEGDEKFQLDASINLITGNGYVINNESNTYKKNMFMLLNGYNLVLLKKG